jgi:endonuclease/exonuclease/phosphatase family metal-dependent hydrolase
MRTEIAIRPGVTLDFWSTHFESGSDGCDEGCHHTQSRELAKAISAWSGLNAFKGQIGNPVLIAGDLNMGGPISVEERNLHLQNPIRYPYTGNPGYESLIRSLFSTRDLWLEAHPHLDLQHEGYTYDAFTNPLAYDSGRERIDYLLSPSEIPFHVTPYQLRARSMDVVRWKTDAGNPISDHYGLDATIEIVRKKP